MIDAESAGPASDVLGNVLGALSRSADVGSRTPREILAQVTETAAATLRVQRVNVWLYDQDRTRVECIEAYDAREGAHSRGDVLLAKEYPHYFVALEALRSIAAVDAENDTRTSELREQYLRPKGITTMLDVPLLQSGRVVGVVCHEHVGSPRVFSATDRLFAGSIGDLVALVLSTNERAALERANARLVERIARTERVESLGWLAGSIAHDFKNWMLVTALNVEMLQGIVADRAQATELVRDIGEITRRAVELCDQLLTYSGREPSERRAVDLGALSADLVRLLQARVPEGASLGVVRGSEGEIVSGDPTQLRQLVLNLILNALDALPERGEHGSVVVRLAREAPPVELAQSGDGFDFRSSGGEFVLLEVRDDGVGMTQETLARVFEPFFTTKANGHGFGLAAAIGIVRGHAGALHIESERGVGTRVRVWLPGEARGSR